MNKSALYILLFFVTYGLLSLVHAYQTNLEVSYATNGLQFTKIEKHNFYKGTQKNDLFFIKDSGNQEALLYKMMSYPSSYSKGLMLKHTSKLGNLEEYQLYTGAFNGDIVFADSLWLTPAERKELIAPIKNVKALRLIQYNTEPFLFKVIDSMLIVFLGFLICIWIFEGFVMLINKMRKKESRAIVSLFFMIPIMIFLHWGIALPWEPAVSGLKLFWVVITILPIYFLFQYAIKKQFPNKETPDQELIKFIILFLGLIHTSFLGAWIIYQLDFSFFRPEVEAPNLIGANWPFYLFVPFFFAAANLTNNLLKRLAKNRQREKELQVSKTEALVSHAELNALQASINPHFLYNSLNSIASLATIDPEKTEKMALALSSFYKYTTNREGQHLTDLNEELEMIQTYLEIEKIRFGGRLNASFEIDKNANDFQIPRFLLQPIVENAIKYGFNKDSNKMDIHLAAKMINNQLELRIFDGGPSFDEDMNIGYGLKSVLKKLKLLFPDRHQIDFINQPKKQVFIKLIKE